MRVNLLSTYHPNYKSNNRNINFASNTNVKETSENIESLLEIKNKVDALMNQNKAQTISAISSYAINQFKSDMQIKLNNTDKFDNIRNKVKILDQISDSYIRQSDFEKALAITTQTIKEINENKTLSSDEKKKLILSPEHWYAIRRYVDSSFYRGNHDIGFITKTDYNQNLLLNLMKQIKTTNYDEFMPFVEFINNHTLGCKSNTERELNFVTREIINKHYDLLLLSDMRILNYSDEGKLNILGEWGLPKHVPIIKKILDNNNYNSSEERHTNFFYGIKALGEIGGQESFEVLKQYALFHSKKDIRSFAYRTIARCNIPEAEKFIEESYDKACHKGDSDYYETLALALSNFNNPTHAKLLKTNLYSNNLKIVAATLNALSNIKSSVTVNILMDYLRTNPKPKSCGWLMNNLYIYLLDALATQDLSSEEIIEIQSIINKNLQNASVNKETKNRINELNKNLGKTQNTYIKCRSYLNSLYPNNLIPSEQITRVPFLEGFTYLNGQYENLKTLNKILDQLPNLSLWNKDEKGYLTTIAGKIEDIEQKCQLNPNLLKHLGWEISISPILIDLYNKTTERSCTYDIYLGNTKEVVDYYKKNNTTYYHFYNFTDKEASGDNISLKALLRGIAQKKIEL